MEISFDNLIRNLQDTGHYPPRPDKVLIRIPNAESLLRRGLNYFTNGNAVWNEGNYRPVVGWVADNQGRGLLLTGECGLGKTLIAMRILPLLINAYCGKIVSCYKAQELNTNPNEVLSRHIVCIDDIGTENISNIYGNKRVPFVELCDMAEQKGKLLIITTNCDIEHLTEKYGVRTVDRLKAITKYVPMVGKSLRR